MSDDYGLVMLDCHHEARFLTAPPVGGEQAYCRRCQTWRVVISQDQEIRLRCRNCKLARRYGVGEDGSFPMRDARALASGHVFRHPAHKVDIVDTASRVVTISLDEQDELPFLVSVSSRIADTRRHQSLLRDAFKGSSGAVQPRSDEG